MRAGDADRIAREVARRLTTHPSSGSRSVVADRTPVALDLPLADRLERLRRAMESVFACSTAFGDCRTERPSAGHCMLAAMVVQDLFGGKILQGEVERIPHYWNALDDKTQIDLTGDQFGRPRLQSARSLYDGMQLTFKRGRGESLVPDLNKEILALHRSFVAKLVPELERCGLGTEASKLERIVASWKQGSPAHRKTDRLVTTTIPKGTLLYHGTQASERFTYPDGPAWFSDSEDVARYFVSWHGPLDHKRPRILTYKVIKPLSRLWLVHTSSDFERWIDKVSPYDRLSDGAEIAAACCAANYRGWHMPHNYPNGSDTLVCEPEEWLEFVREERIGP